MHPLHPLTHNYPPYSRTLTNSYSCLKRMYTSKLATVSVMIPSPLSPPPPLPTYTLLHPLYTLFTLPYTSLTPPLHLSLTPTSYSCLKRMYRSKLPTVSVVIPFHQEHITTLSRTIQSIVNRSPKPLLHEIIIVDDFSKKG